jgi:hypothetical protein
MEMNETLLLIAAHFLGDFPFQSEWMIKNKGISWEINAYHSLTYTATMYVVTFLGKLTLPIWFFGAIALSHFLIDPLKARYNVIKSIWLDQALHIAVIYLLSSMI